MKRAPTPVASHRCGTWQPRLGSQHRWVLGRPTVRKAESPSGNKMVQEAKAGSRKAAGKRDMFTGSSLVVAV